MYGLERRNVLALLGLEGIGVTGTWITPLHTSTSAVFCIGFPENLNQNSEMLCLL